jgi:predicted amidohydrolase
LLDRAGEAGAELAVLPEYFDYLGTDEGALAAAEPVPGRSPRPSLPERVRSAFGGWPARSGPIRIPRVDRFI